MEETKNLKEIVVSEIEKLNISESQKELLKKQIEGMSDQEISALLKNQQCFFCSVASGKFEVVKIYETDMFIAFLDAYPASPGHTIIISKEHKLELSDDEIAALISFVKKIIKAFSFFGFSFNLVVSQGTGSGQTFDHFTLHLIPRKENDNVQFGWRKNEASREQLEEIAKMFIGAIESIEAKKADEIEKVESTGVEQPAEETKSKVEKEDKAEEKIDKILKFIKERKP
ncbi:MAG: HIT family protein [Candidatus Pacearchaeota archaeon]